MYKKERKQKYMEKNSNDEFHKVAHTKAWNFKSHIPYTTITIKVPHTHVLEKAKSRL